MTLITSLTPWHIAGVGAIGSIIAANFCRSNQSIQLLLKNEQQLKEYQSTKLKIMTEDYEYSCHPSAFCITTPMLPISFLICCTKAYDVSVVLEQLAPKLTGKTLVILIHNGLGVLDEIKTQWPHLRIIAGITSIGGYIQQPYQVNAFLRGHIKLGATMGEITEREVSTILTAFNNSTLNCLWSENIELEQYKKFAINCCINLLTVIYSCRNGGLMQHTNVLNSLIKEVAAVLRVQGKALDEAWLKHAVYQVIKATASNYSSTYKDVQQGRLTEMKYLNERLVNLARQKNSATPVNESLLQQFYCHVVAEI